MEFLHSICMALLSGTPPLPTAPGGDPATLAQNGIAFFETWITRVGGLVAFIGAVKFALATKSDDAKEQLLAVLTMVSGFMIQAAVGDLSIFNIPTTFSDAAATTEFRSILRFIGKWIRRVGMLGMLIGGILFAFSMKDKNAATKVTATKTITAGGFIAAVASIIDTFV